MFFRFPCHVQNCCHIRPLPIICGWLKKGRRRAGRGGGVIPNLSPFFLTCHIHLDTYCRYHAGYPLILACNAETPTSGDLKSGVSLFFTPPPPPPKCQQPHHLAPPSCQGFGRYMKSYMNYMLSKFAFHSVISKQSFQWLNTCKNE